MDWHRLFHHTVCGAIAAAGFGVLFNIRNRGLLWCAMSGGLALLIRTFCQLRGWNLESSSFAAALVVGFTVHFLQKRVELSHNALDVAGCIPMIPGSFAAKAILGLFALTVPEPNSANETLIIAVEYSVRVMFTIGAIGTGLAVPNLLFRMKDTGRE